MNIDKSSWQPVTLGNICTKKEENDRENASSNFDRFLKVEHLDADSLHIKRWGEIVKDELPPTFYKIFRKGQVLYPTRNPHLRRVALASFDGICGEKTLTLEANNELVDEQFFPQLFLSHSFYSHTTSAIVGSTNPHVRWRDVADFKILLPPKDQQAKLAELLWAADETIERLEELMKSELIVKDCLRKVFFKDYKGKFVKAGTIFKLTAGGTPSTSERRYWENGSIKWMASGDVHKKRIYDVEGRITEDGLNNSSTKILPENSVVIALAGQGKTKGTVAITKVELCTNQSVAAFLPNKQLFLPEFLFHYLDSKYDDFREMKGDSNSRTGLNLAILKEIQVPNLTILEQEAIVTRINIVEDCILEIGNQISKTQLIKKQLINQIFSA